jgi:hypothetical protein
MLIIDIYSLGFTSNTFGASGSININQGQCTGGVGSIPCNNNPQSVTPTSTCSPAWWCGFTSWIGGITKLIPAPCTSPLGTTCITSQSKQLTNEVKTGAVQAIFSFIGITDNPFTDPLGFVGGIIIVLGIVMLFAVAVLGTEILNAGTAYLLFMASAIIIIWLGLLNAGASVFSTFPCYNFTTSQMLWSGCSTISVPVSGNVVSIGLMIELILSLSVAIGTLDLIAI